MTPDEQRIAIAQACGWKGISFEYLTGYAPWRPTPYSERVMGDLDSIPIDPLPDYLNDLNAMHEAEKVLTWQHHLTFREQLWDLVITLGPEDTWGRQFISATAAQRAEAFLRTLNLWK
jgi:hypothetical protein